MSKKKRARRNGTIAALDLGSTKVACFVAKADGDGAPRVVGIGHQISHGVRGGTIVDLDEAEQSILSAVSAAEQMAGETLKSVIVNLVGGAPVSRTFGVEVALNGHEIGDADLRRVIEQARQTQTATDKRIIHQFPVGFTIDGSRGIRDPRGMCGERLGVNMHMVGASSASVRNLETAVARCHLEIEEPVVPAYAAGLACLVQDEKDLGACVIDMGGGTTSFAVFFDGHCVFVDQINVGGSHVTNDIARGLSTPLAHAERMKTLHGSCIHSANDERELVDVPLVGEEEQTQANHVPKSILTGIVAPRLEETFELVRSRLEASGFDKIAGRRVVLTGGASQLQGTRELAAMILDKQVRMGKPSSQLTGLADQTGGPAFAACAGLILHAHQKGTESLRPETAAAPSAGVFGGLRMWLRDNL